MASDSALVLTSRALVSSVGEGQWSRWPSLSALLGLLPTRSSDVSHTGGTLVLLPGDFGS